MRKTYKNLKIFALSAMMALTGCGLDSSNDVAFNENQNSFTDESSEKISTNKKIPGVGVKTIDDQEYDEDTNSVDSNYIDDTEFVVTTMPLESGTSTTVYTTVVGDNDFTESVGGKSETKASKTGTNNGGSSTRTNTPQTDNRKPNVTTAASKSTKKETTTTAKPIVTTITSVSTQPTQPPEPPQTSQPAIEPPAPREYTIDDICNDDFALEHFAKKFCDDLAVGNDGFFYIGGRELCDYSVGLYVVAALNCDVVDEEVLAKALGGNDMSSFIDDSMFFLGAYSKLQKKYGFSINFSDYICTQKDPNGDYANYLNTLQYYGSNNSILDFANEHKGDYAGDLIATNLLYAYQKDIPDDDNFMSYSEVIDASTPFNNRVLDAVNNYSYAY